MCGAFALRMGKRPCSAIAYEGIQASFRIRFCGDDGKHAAARPSGAGTHKASDSVTVTKAVAELPFSFSIKAHSFVRISGPFSVIRMEFS